MTRVVKEYASHGASASLKVRKYSAGYVVTTDIDNPSEVSVLSISGLPVVRSSTWPDDPAAICESYSLDQEERNIFRIRYDYATQTSNPDDDKDNPLDRPWKPAWSFIERDTFPAKDVNGKVFQASNGQLLVGAVAVPQAFGVLTIVRNEPTFNYLDAMKYSNKLNQAVFYGALRKNVLCKPISATEEYEKGVAFAAVTYTFHFSPDPQNDVLFFDMALVDHGRWELIDGKHVLPKDDDTGVPYSDDILLDGNGKKLPQADVDAGDMAFLAFSPYKTISFGPLKLNQTEPD